MNRRSSKFVRGASKKFSTNIGASGPRIKKVGGFQHITPPSGRLNHSSANLLVKTNDASNSNRGKRMI